MRHDSELFKVLSPDIIPALDLGSTLSICNNRNHPTLTAKEIDVLENVKALLEQWLPTLVQAGNDLKPLSIRTNEWFLALNYLNSYVYIINETLNIPANVRAYDYALSKKAGAK